MSNILISRFRTPGVTYLSARSSVLNLVRKAAIMSLKKIVNAIGLGQSRADRMKRIRAKSTKLVFSDLNFELEKRQLLVTTSFSSELLTINLDAVGEILTLTSDGTTLSLSSSAAISGAGSSFATSSVKQLAVSDSGLLAGQLSRLLSMRAGCLSSSVPLQSRSHGFVPAWGRFTSHTIALECDTGRLAQNQVGHGFSGGR